MFSPHKINNIRQVYHKMSEYSTDITDDGEETIRPRPKNKEYQK